MSTPVLLRTRNLSRSFGGLHAVSALDLEVHAGEIVCLIGPNGAGKSTTFNMIAGALAPSDGEILFDGVPMNHLATHEVARRGIARTFQHNHPFAGMSIIENVMVGMHARLQRPLWKTLTQVRQHVGEEQGARDRALELLEFVGLAHCRDMDVNTLSFGQGRLLEVARCLASRPRLVLLDEPAAGLTHSECANLANIVRSVAGQGVAVLLIEHDMPLVMDVAERLVVLNFGKKIADGDPQFVKADAAVIEAYLGHMGGRHHA